MNTSVCRSLYEQALGALHNRMLFGHEQLLRYCMLAFFAGGHVLVEGPPGTGKTMTAKLMARLLARSFRRIQFTSDMLPSDLIGAHLFNPAANRFDFLKGPLFADFIIADEVNRTPPRTQSALLEAMEERQVTVEGETFSLGREFFVVATQNPHDFEGTYPLPESQLDRFLFKVILSNAAPETEVEILDHILRGLLPPSFESITPLAYDRAQIDQELALVVVDRSLLGYVARVLARTREHQLLSYGSGVRGGIAIVRSARVSAVLEGRNFVIPEDIKAIILPTLRHRIRTTADAQIANVTEDAVLEQIITETPFPS